MDSARKGLETITSVHVYSVQAAPCSQPATDLSTQARLEPCRASLIIQLEWWFLVQHGRSFSLRRSLLIHIVGYSTGTPCHLVFARLHLRVFCLRYRLIYPPPLPLFCVFVAMVPTGTGVLPPCSPGVAVALQLWATDLEHTKEMVEETTDAGASLRSHR